MNQHLLNGRLPALLTLGIAMACGFPTAMAAEEGKGPQLGEPHHKDKPGAEADPHAGHHPEAASPRKEAPPEGHEGHDAAPAPGPRKMKEERKTGEKAQPRQAAHRKEIREMMHRAHELARDGKPEEAEALRRKAREQMGPGPRPGQGPPQGPPADAPASNPKPNPLARLKHLEQAIGHLREAGLQEPAENLENVARRLREEIRQQERPREGAAEIEALRREVRELREALRQAQEKP